MPGRSCAALCKQRSASTRNKIALKHITEKGLNSPQCVLEVGSLCSLLRAGINRGEKRRQKTKLYKLHQDISNLNICILKAADLTSHDWMTTLQVDQRPYIFVFELGGSIAQHYIGSIDSSSAVPSILPK